ncbi:MAG: LacI family DNA-binding transcriptional regulator [Roseiflexaceae bacterium]|nr:LacI family DNA-binding transcriptional regulator [Roseiflexaceae bacterium]
MRRITIREVARRAGVSYQTVSRVINNSPDVSVETREQVQRAIADLDYHPNAQAVSLSRNRSNIVGMIVDRAGDSFFGPMVDGACQALAERGRFMLLAQTDNLEQPSAIEALLRSRRIDGLILVLPLEPSLEQARNLVKSQLPLVLVDLQYDIDADYISVDSYRGAYAATKHLIELGHRRIGIVYNRQDIPVGLIRLSAYQAALQDYGIAFDPVLALPGKWGVASGKEGAEQLLALSERPTAIFTCDDQMAIGALQTIYRHGLRVPEDISLVGFDDIEYAQYLHPPLTTVRQPLREMGYTAGEHICRMIDGTMIGRLQLTLASTLIIRDSTAPPANL